MTRLLHATGLFEDFIGAYDEGNESSVFLGATDSSIGGARPFLSTRATIANF